MYADIFLQKNAPPTSRPSIISSAPSSTADWIREQILSYGIHFQTFYSSAGAKIKTFACGEITGPRSASASCPAVILSFVALFAN